MTIQNGINVKYIYSACIVIRTPDLSILCDPWFTDGIFDGSWYQFPVCYSPIESIGDVDYIYISHIHPDHYDPVFLKKYFSVYGNKEVLIANHKNNYLYNKMKLDGISSFILEKPLSHEKTSIEIIPDDTGSPSDIDSALIVKYWDNHRFHCVANANDIIFDDKMRNEFASKTSETDILLCGYSAAGPYPHTYYDLDDPALPVAAEQLKQELFERYKLLIRAVDAKVNIPFAGKYLLGGKLSKHNQFRGIPDAVEVLDIDKCAIILSDNGGEIDTVNLQPSATRNLPYSQGDIDRRITEIQGKSFDYEHIISDKDIQKVPIIPLMKTAYYKALKKSQCDFDYYFVFQFGDENSILINTNKNNPQFEIHKKGLKDNKEPYSKIRIDLNYLFGLLVGLYHWNNAEIGSHFEVRRKPDLYQRKAQAFLHFFSLI